MADDDIAKIPISKVVVGQATIRINIKSGKVSSKKNRELKHSHIQSESKHYASLYTPSRLKGIETQPLSNMVRTQEYLRQKLKEQGVLHE